MGKFFKLNLMPDANPSYCFLEPEPKEVGLATHRLSRGIAIAEEFPPTAYMRMDPDESGIELPDLVGNSGSLLVVSSKIKAVIEEVNRGPTEYLRIAIRNHKGRVASADYFIVNPLGSWDCLDIAASRIEFHEGKVVGIDAIVLDAAKVAKAPDLFRIPEHLGSYVVSERLVRALVRLDPRPTNVFLIELAQS